MSGASNHPRLRPCWYAPTATHAEPKTALLPPNLFESVIAVSDPEKVQSLVPEPGAPSTPITIVATGPTHAARPHHEATSRLIVEGDTDADPALMYQAGANHGTSCCGVAAGEADGILTVGAAPAYINALIDALSVRGIDHVDMPATPHRLWRLLHGQ